MTECRTLVGGLVASVALVLAATAGATPGPRGLSLTRVAESDAWRNHVLDRNDGFIYPKHVYVVAGSSSQVDNRDGLTEAGGGVTTLHASGQGTPRLVLDLGLDAGGYVEVGVTRSDGTTVHLGYSEARRFLTPDGDQVRRPDTAPDGEPGPRSDDVTGVGDWRSPSTRGGERWISLQLQSAGTVSIDYVRVRTEHLHPALDDYTGHFLSSDDLLNRIWYASVYVFTLDSVKDLRPGHDKGRIVVVDGAKRDRAVWLGDLAVEHLLGAYGVRQAPGVTRDSLQVFSCLQAADGSLAPSTGIDQVCPGDPPGPDSSRTTSILPEYTAWWVIALHDYELFTGDDAFARKMLPVARLALTAFTNHLDANGLYSTSPVAINWHPFDVAGGEDSHTNATIYRALMNMADLERRVGAGDAAARGYDQQAAALRRAMLAHLWDAEAGAFVLNSSDPANHSQDAQVEAVLDGVITGEQAASAMRFIDDHLSTTYGVRNGESDHDPYMTNYISPFISSTELLARLSRHDTAGALGLMRREWGHMVDTDPNTASWERIAFNGEIATGAQGGDVLPSHTPNLGAGFPSFAHGWAGGPVPALSGYIVGIRPLTPGYATWIVEPQLGDLRFAQGQAPTPRGAVVSRWTRGAKDRSFVLTAGGPTGTAGEVAVPVLGANRVIARDGRVVWDGHAPVGGVQASSDGTYVRFDHQRGLHTYAWSTGADKRACRGRTVVVRPSRGLRRAVVYVGRRRAGILRSPAAVRRGLRVRLRGRSPVAVRIIGTDHDGHRRVSVRRYKLC